MKTYTDYSLLRHNTFGIDEPCRRFVEVDSVAEAQTAARQLGRDGQPLLVVGGGSNMLFTRPFPGTVLHSAIRGIEARHTNNNIMVRAGSGEQWDALVALCVEQGWHGAENLSLIPGEVGASAAQNIGAYGAEAADLIDSVEAVCLADGSLVTIAGRDCGYGYRQSRFKQEWRGQYLITHVTYRLSATFSPRLDYGNLRDHLAQQHIDTPTPQQLRQTIIDIRREKLPDPAVEGNAGSFFMNPVVDRNHYDRIARRHAPAAVPHYDVDATRVKIPAAWLIEQCGWKGRTLGRAGVHSRQPLVLVNRGGASGADIVALCDAIRNDVAQRFDIMLLPEVNIVGDLRVEI